jgi:malate dehydrogenase (oxaloacetate-decarboxylating)
METCIYVAKVVRYYEKLVDSYFLFYNLKMKLSQNLKIHRRINGKIQIELKDSLDSVEKLSTYYTPGVAEVSQLLANHPEEVKQYTWTNNLVAVISDGSAVLGLGNIGPIGALPVMEGKAMLFKQLAKIDAIPIVLNDHSAEGIIRTIKSIANSFGAINLEDIAAPICFEVEEKLKNTLSIPVMHDDQHGTAIVVLAGLINAMKVVHKNINDCKIVVVGVGAAGTAIIKLIHEHGPKSQIIAVDSKGIISKDRNDLNNYKKELLKISNPKDIKGGLKEAILRSDVFIGVSKPKLLTTSDIKIMAEHPIIFALANPEPEIYPEEALRAGAAIVATGRSDFPNQINNALAFPGIFRGALDNKVTSITTKHKLLAAQAIADLIQKPTPDKIVPGIFSPKLVKNIAKLIK